MAWTIKFLPKIKKELRKLDKNDSKAILNFLKNEVLPSKDPRSLAIKLKKNLKEYWKFRLGNFRIIAHIQNNELTILVVRVANRKDVYSKFEKPKKETRVIPFATLQNLRNNT